jgi:adenylosuccinate synthase
MFGYDVSLKPFPDQRMQRRLLGVSVSRTVKRTAVAVLDGNLGDGAKGATVDFLAATLGAAKVVRVGSGPNAGHGVVSPFGNFYIFNQVPSGAFTDAKLAICRGMAVDPIRLVTQELEDLRRLGFSNVLGRLILDPESPVVTPVHVLLKRIAEVSRGSVKGSTGRGCGEARSDVGNEMCIRMGDLLDEATLRVKLESLLPSKKEILEGYIATALPGTRSQIDHYYNPAVHDRLFDADYLTGLLLTAASVIGHRITPAGNADPVISALQLGKPVILEWAQGVCLDKEFGTVPNTCPYPTTLQALEAETNIPIEALKLVVIVARAYGTRHGPGFFPTEMIPSEVGEERFASLRDAGSDTVDGNWPLSFRAGWLDLAMLKFAVEDTYAVLKRAGQADKVEVCLAISCLDKLDGVGRIKVCTHYEYTNPEDFEALKAAGISVSIEDGGSLTIDKFHHALSENPAFRRNIRPVYEEMEGWNAGGRNGYHDIALGRSFECLPPQMQNFLHLIETTVGAPVKIVGVGPERQMRIADRKLMTLFPPPA